MKQRQGHRAQHDVSCDSSSDGCAKTSLSSTVSDRGLHRRIRVWIATTYLQGLLTNDIVGLKSGKTGCYAADLDAARAG